MGKFKRGFELATAHVTTGVIIPFYIGGLWGTKWSRSNSNFKEKENSYKKDVIISFGKPINIKMNTTQVKKKVFELSTDSWDKYINGFLNIDRVFINTVKRNGHKIAIVDSSGEEYSYIKMMTIVLFFKKLIGKHMEQNIGLLVPTTSIGGF